MNHYNESTKDCARRLPDDLFDDHPEVVEARAALAHANEVLAAAQAEVGKGNARARAVEQHLEKLKSAFRGNAATFRELALADLDRGDLTFATAIEARNRFDAIERQIEAAQAALDAFAARQRSERPADPQAHAVREAKQRLARVIERLKLQHAEQLPVTERTRIARGR